MPQQTESGAEGWRTSGDLLEGLMSAEDGGGGIRDKDTGHQHQFPGAGSSVCAAMASRRVTLTLSYI